MKESAIQRSILDYLAAKHVLAFRMNSGTMKSSYNGKARFVRFGVPGMADVLAFPAIELRLTCSAFLGTEHSAQVRIPVWIECKAEKGKQSPLQKSFQAQVEAEGHKYIVARSIADVEAAL